MGANLGGRGVSDPIVAINVTPLVDICLVLVIIFMVTAPLIAQNGIVVNSVKKEVGNAATPETAPAEPTIEAIYVKILPEADAIELNTERIPWSEFPGRIKGYLLNSEDQTVYLNTQAGVTYGQVVKVLDVCRQQGAVKLAMLNDHEGLLERTLIFKRP